MIQDYGGKLESRKGQTDMARIMMIWGAFFENAIKAGASSARVRVRKKDQQDRRGRGKMPAREAWTTSASSSSSKTADWVCTRDAASLQYYYYSVETNEVSWTYPTGEDTLGRRYVVWTEHEDKATGRAYYYNKESNTSTWSLPPPTTKLGTSRRQEREGLERWESLSDADAAAGGYGGYEGYGYDGYDGYGGGSASYDKAVEASVSIAASDFWNSSAAHPWDSRPSSAASSPRSFVSASETANALVEFNESEKASAWVEYWDENAQVAYYYNEVSGESSYERPDEQRYGGGGGTVVWQTVYDEGSKSYFYYDHRSGTSTWELGFSFSPGAGGGAGGGATQAWGESSKVEFLEDGDAGYYDEHEEQYAGLEQQQQGYGDSQQGGYDGIASEWELTQDETGKSWWYNHSTGEWQEWQEWQEDQAAAAGAHGEDHRAGVDASSSWQGGGASSAWQLLYDEQGNAYWYNEETGESSWAEEEEEWAEEGAGGGGTASSHK